MRTIEEIKNEVSIKNGFENWDAVSMYEVCLILDEMMQEYAKQRCDEQIGEFGFGSYCQVEQKRYVGENEFYLYKVISVIESNSWVDVPVDYRINKAVPHDSIEKVVTCICMGVSEDTVTRFKLSDVIQLSTPNVVKTNTK